MKESMYHYTMCGLDNVWLKTGYTIRDTPHGKGVSIVAVDALHRLLAAQLVKKAGRLTGKELRFLRVQMGLSQTGLAKLQGVSENAVSLWERHGKVPRANDALTRLFYLGQVEGDTTLKQAIDRVKTIESLVHQKIVAKATGSKWSSKVEAADASYVVAA
jgi:DNA-binding transcriptional regulator YiaG